MSNIIDHFDNSSSEDFYHLDIDQTAQSFLNTKSEQWQISLDDAQFAAEMDENDPLRYLRQEFCYPKMCMLPNGLYQMNSSFDSCQFHSIHSWSKWSEILGRMHVSMRSITGIDACSNEKSHEWFSEWLGYTVSLWSSWHLIKVLFWLPRGVCGHFAGSNPWAECDKPCLPAMSLLVGGRIQEVAVMNQLSSNLHFMMVGFSSLQKSRLLLQPARDLREFYSLVLTSS